MRRDIILPGIVLIVIGIILIWIGIHLSTEDPYDQKDVVTGLGIENTGEYVAAGGIIIFCVGIFLPENKQQNQQPVQQPQSAQQQYQQPVQRPIQQQTYSCSNCGQPLRYVNQYQKWYCDTCKNYI